MLKPLLDNSITKECENLINSYYIRPSDNFPVNLPHDKSWNDDLSLQKTLTKEIFELL